MKLIAIREIAQKDRVWFIHELLTHEEQASLDLFFSNPVMVFIPSEVFRGIIRGLIEQLDDREKGIALAKEWFSEYIDMVEEGKIDGTPFIRELKELLSKIDEIED